MYPNLPIKIKRRQGAKIKKIIFILIITILVGGCASYSVNLYENRANYKPTNPKEVRVFHKIPQDRDFIELGEVTVSGVDSWSWAENALKKKTAELGGDAVYIINKSDTSEGAMVGHLGAFDTTLIVTGVVIKYKDTVK